MKDLLVGSTGFVGGNLIQAHDFECICHSSNINCYYSSEPDLCVYAGIPSAMFLANSNPDADLNIMKQARTNIRSINPKKLVLISSIAVFRDSRGKDETSIITDENLSAYGKNRLLLEKWVKEDYPTALIVRLPALYGKGLKKNFLFDLHHIVPAMLRPEIYELLAKDSSLVREGFSLGQNGFFSINQKADYVGLKSYFMNNRFNALSFTDSRSRYQFYDLRRLWNDVRIALDNELLLLHICTPPVSAKTIYETVTGRTDWNNELYTSPYDYDMRTVHSRLFGEEGGYLCGLDDELYGIKRFMDEWKD